MQFIFGNGTKLLRSFHYTLPLLRLAHHPQILRTASATRSRSKTLCRKFRSQKPTTASLLPQETLEYLRLLVTSGAPGTSVITRSLHIRLQICQLSCCQFRSSMSTHRILELKRPGTLLFCQWTSLNSTRRHCNNLSWAPRRPCLICLLQNLRTRDTPTPVVSHSPVRSGHPPGGYVRP